MSAPDIPGEIKDKLVEHFNEMLSAENAAIDRLDSRIQECLLPEGKQQLQHHQDETRAHQERLKQIITDLGGSPTFQSRPSNIKAANRDAGKKDLN